ncbi:MAG: SMC-Scp complex subunit ScpB [Candidatus Moranbacteria bacterium RIFCSPHIGHO2_01_FULL_55_24]|nr:MAG: SMC-Scp complex subunit ScpB [Candidatus Moranbacteria bacterium RIFCSPHIGHO2_01_FULL_55_24]
MPTPQDIAALEAILFVSGEPLPIRKIAKILEIDEPNIRAAAAALRERYENDPSSGLQLIENGDAVRLTTKAGNQNAVEAITKSSLQEHLSKAALEVLAIIAYRAPISRAEIETIRGVNCSFTLRNLLLRELVEREGNPNDLRGYLYSPSFKFLESLGLGKREDLPDFETLSQDERLTVLMDNAEETLPETRAVPQNKEIS